MNAAPEQTATQAPELELEELLSESPADAARRAASRFSLRAGDAPALYGAGQLGRQVLARLRTLGWEPLAFADDTPAKQGTRIDGLPVVSPREFVEKFGERAIFVVTIFHPAASFLRIKQGVGTPARVFSFLELAWKYHETFLPHYQFELPQDVLENG